MQRTTWLNVHEGESLPDLSRRRHRNSLFLGCHFRRLNDAVLERCSLQQCWLDPKSPAELLGFSPTMDCFVYDHLQANAIVFDTLLGLLCRTQGNNAKRRQLASLVPAAIHAELAATQRPHQATTVWCDQDFANVRGQRFRQAHFVGCRFRTITNAVFDHCRFEACQMEPRTYADILGVTLTLNPDSLDGMQCSELFLDGLLSLLCRMEGAAHEAKRERVRELILPEHWAQLARLEEIAARFGWSAPDVALVPDGLLEALASDYRK